MARLGTASCRVIALTVLLIASATLASVGTPSGAAVVAEYDGIIHPVAAEFFDDVITRAESSGARVVVLVLRTPGGLLDSTRTIVSRMIAARLPVVVFVAPSGARAASAGFIIVLAADIAAMAPGTHIGAAHPVPAGGQESTDKTTADKAAADTAAYARTLATSRGRNVALAAEAVLESRAFTEQEALKADPPLVDLVASDVDDLLRKLHGRSVKRFDGTSVTLDTRDVVLERVDMTRRQQLLSAIAHPQIAYLLLTLGILGLTVEMWNPGAIAPGVVGGICLLLAFFAFQVLPVNAAGVLLILFGVALLILEVKIPSFGILGVGGTMSLLAGSVLLVTEVPGVTVSYRMVVSVVLALAGIILFLGRLALKAQRQAAVTGAEGLIGQQGRALTAITDAHPGQITLRGEIWRAASDRSIPAGDAVRVVGLDGLTLRVEPLDVPLPEGATT